MGTKRFMILVSQLKFLIDLQTKKYFIDWLKIVVTWQGAINNKKKSKISIRHWPSSLARFFLFARKMIYIPGSKFFFLFFWPTKRFIIINLSNFSSIIMMVTEYLSFYCYYYYYFLFCGQSYFPTHFHKQPIQE